MLRVGSTKWALSPLGTKRDQILVSTDPSALYPELATTEKLTSLMQWTGNEYVFINRAKGYFIASVDGTSWKKWYSPIGPNMVVATGLGKVATIRYSGQPNTGYVYDYATQSWTQFSASSTVAPVGFHYNGVSFAYWGSGGSSSGMVRGGSPGSLTAWAATQSPSTSSYPLPDRGIDMASRDSSLGATWILCLATSVCFASTSGGVSSPVSIPTASSNNMTSTTFSLGGACVCDGVAGNGTIYKYLTGAWTAQLGPTTVDTLTNGNGFHVAWRSDTASAIIKKSTTGATGTWTDVAVTSRTYYSGAYGTSGWKFWTSDGIVSVTI